MIIRPAGPLGPTWAATSTVYDARREQLEDLAKAVAPFLRDQLPPSCRPEVHITEHPTPLALVVHLGVDALPPELEAKVIDIMQALRNVQQRAFPTLPLTLEVLRPPLNRYGFVAHFDEKRAPEPVYPRFLAAKAVVRLHRADLLGKLKGIFR